MATEESDQGYPGKRAAEIAGITYRQLDYWARTDLVRPSLARATGSGSRRRYSYRDLLELRDRRWRLTERGLPVADRIGTEFLDLTSMATAKLQESAG